MRVAEAVTPLIAPAVEALGVELYDLEYVKEGGERILRLYIDKAGGVDINDCERVSHAAEAILDARDPIPEAYLLEVSSPGIERRLTTAAHFARYIGHKVSVKLFAPVEGKKTFTGVLTAYADGAVSLREEDGAARRFDEKQLSLCRLSVF